MTKQPSDITWKIGGEAGFGIMTTGELFARASIRAGLHVFTYPEYPSLIRGGHNTVQVTVSSKPVTAHRTQVNVLIALNRETLDLHLAEVLPNGAIIFDTTDRSFADLQPDKLGRTDIQMIGLPLQKLAVEGGGQKLMRNTVALGASCALLEIPADRLSGIIQDTFGHKGEEVVRVNTNVLMAGYKAISSELQQACPWSFEPAEHAKEQIMITGNDALALGSIQAGCQFFSSYPMTPASSILHFLAEHGRDYGMIVRHAEDEIGAVHHAIGAAYTGVRAMTATSGGGFSLMTEAVGLAAMTEVGMVIVDAQRPGPSTGMPTWTEQGDLRQVLHASQGDFPRIVLAPSSHTECFAMIQDAFNLADEYQTPVIVLTDKYLAEGLRNVAIDDLKVLPMNRGKIWPASKEKTDKEFFRYREDVADGIAPRSLPGTPDGLFLANSDEHDEFGYSNEEISHRVAQVERRARKISTLRKKVMAPRVIGPAKAQLTVVTWGSSAGPVEAALHLAQEKYKLEVNAVVITMIAPFPAEELEALMSTAQKTAIVEANRSGKLAGYIREQTGLTFDHSLKRFDGRPFDPVALADEFASIVKTS